MLTIFAGLQPSETCAAAARYILIVVVHDVDNPGRTVNDLGRVGRATHVL